MEMLFKNNTLYLLAPRNLLDYPQFEFHEWLYIITPVRDKMLNPQGYFNSLQRTTQ